MGGVLFELGCGLVVVGWPGWVAWVMVGAVASVDVSVWIVALWAGAVAWLVWVSLVGVVCFGLGVRVVAVGWRSWVASWVDDV